MKQWSTLKKLIWLRAMSAVKEYSGAVVTFFTNAVKPLKALIINLPPVQDLHGYSSPWPAGGGVSKCPSFANGTHTMTNGLTVTIQDGEITINGTASGSGYYEEAIESTVMPADAYVSCNNPAATYNIAYVFINGNAQIAAISTAPANATKQPTGLSGATVNRLRIFCNAGNYDNFKMSPIVHDGSTPQAWQPYANICPISGRTGLNVYRTGKNLFIKATSITNNGVTFTVNSDGSISLSGTASANAFFIAFQNVLFKAGAYTIHKSDNANIQIILRNATAAGTNIASASTSNAIFSLSQDTLCAGVIRVASGTVTTGITLYPMIELGSTATAYESYQGTTYPVTWQTEAGTVYGGTVDVVSGVLTVDRALWQKNTATMDNAENYPGWKNSGIKDMIGGGIRTVQQATMNIGSEFGANTTDSYDIVYLRIPTYGKTQAEWIALAQDVQIIVTLATPVTYQLTPQEVKSLVGQNVVWSDAGEVTVRV